jgi:hypothetical protein
MPKQNKKRVNEGEGAGSSSSPPLKRQKIGVASSSTAVSDGTAARIRQLEQRLQSAEDKNARLEERLQLQEEENQRLHALNVSMRQGTRRYGSSFNGKTTDTDIIDNLTRLSPLAVHYNANVTNQFIRDVPEMLWWQKILRPFLNLEDLSILRRTNTFFQLYWESVLRQNVIRVPQGCPTLEKAIALAVVFSERKEYTEADPLKVEMDKGVHEITDSNYVPDSEDDDGSYDKTMLIPCSHITFVGKGKHQTTIRGGFFVRNQQNVKFEEMTVTNPVGCGMEFHGSETNVEMLKCIVEECGNIGMLVIHGATMTTTQCEFMENGGSGVFCCNAPTKARLNDCKMHHNDGDGLVAYTGAVVDLHGTKTGIHSNTGDGILAVHRSKVNIHLPSQHNTSHDNVGGDRVQNNVGSIANINTDGTFTHVGVEEDDADDN